MARRIKEEQVTKAILKWLMSTGWEIVCFDFPQSGSGKVLHPIDTNSKTDGSIIPDIIAVKAPYVVHFENKDRFVLEDFNKVFYLKNTTVYDNAYSELLDGYSYSTIFYGIGMPYSTQNYSKALSELSKIDFVVFLKDDGGFEIIDSTGTLF